MTLPAHIRELRDAVGHDLLLLPSVSVLVTDGASRVLLVRHSANGPWGLVGGAIEVDESPQDAATREAREETGLEVELTGLLGALGGPDYRVTYPNGDETAYVSIVYAAAAAPGQAQPDGVETVDVGWFAIERLPETELSRFAESTLSELGWITPSNRHDGLGDSVERTIAAPTRAVYRAWTEGFDRWFAEPGTLWMQPIVGAPYFFETSHLGSRHPHYGRFVDLETDRRIVMTWVTQRGTEGAETTVTVELEPVGHPETTKLSLNHDGFPNAASMQRHFPAWNENLARLEMALTADAS